MTITIKGKEWTIKFQPPKLYVKKHGTDSDAITDANIRTIFFKTDTFTPEVIRHELFHAFVNETNTNSSALTPLQMEELCCSLVGDHFHDIAILTDKILDMRLRRHE